MFHRVGTHEVKFLSKITKKEDMRILPLPDDFVGRRSVRRAGRSACPTTIRARQSDLVNPSLIRQTDIPRTTTIRKRVRPSICPSVPSTSLARRESFRSGSYFADLAIPLSAPTTWPRALTSRNYGDCLDFSCASGFLTAPNVCEERERETAKAQKGKEEEDEDTGLRSDGPETVFTLITKGVLDNV